MKYHSQTRQHSPSRVSLKAKALVKRAAAFLLQERHAAASSSKSTEVGQHGSTQLESMTCKLKTKPSKSMLLWRFQPCQTPAQSEVFVTTQNKLRAELQQPSNNEIVYDVKCRSNRCRFAPPRSDACHGVASNVMCVCLPTAAAGSRALWGERCSTVRLLVNLQMVPCVCMITSISCTRQRTLHNTRQSDKL